MDQMRSIVLFCSVLSHDSTHCSDTLLSEISWFAKHCFVLYLVADII